MIVPAGYVPVKKFSYWLADILDGKLVNSMNGMAPEDFDILKARFNGELKGTLRRTILTRALGEIVSSENISLYLCLPDRTIAFASRDIAATISDQKGETDLLLVNDEYKHIDINEFFDKVLKFSRDTDASVIALFRWCYEATMAEHKELKRQAQTFSRGNDWINDFADKNAQFFAGLVAREPEASNRYTSNEIEAMEKDILRGVFGGLAGALLVVKEEDERAVKALLIDRLNTTLSKFESSLIEKGMVQQSKPVRYSAADVKRKMIELLKRERKRLDGEKRLTIKEIYTDVTNAIPGVTKNFLNETKREIYRENPNLKLPAGRPAKTHDK